MKNIEKLYQKLSETDIDELYLLEGEFLLELYDSVPSEKRPLCATAFSQYQIGLQCPVEVGCGHGEIGFKIRFVSQSESSP